MLLAVLLQVQEPAGVVLLRAVQVAVERVVAAADAVRLVIILARLLWSCTRWCWRCCCGCAYRLLWCSCASCTLQWSLRCRRRTRCAWWTYFGTVVEAVHAVLLVVPLQVQVPAVVLLLRVVHISVVLVVAAADAVRLVIILARLLWPCTRCCWRCCCGCKFLLLWCSCASCTLQWSLWWRRTRRWA